MSWQTIVKENNLAVAEKTLSESVSAFRFDAEYFQPHYIENELVIAKKECKTLDEITDDLKSFGAYSLTNQITYQESGIPFVRCTDVKDGYVDFSRVYYIDEKTNKLLWKSKVDKGTVLLCMSGSVGNCAVAEENWNYPVNSNQDIAKIILKEGLNPYFVAAFFNSTYGRLQIMRLPIGSVQQHIFLWQLKTMKVPIVSKKLQEEVADVYKKALIQQKKAEERFTEAEQTLLKEINLEGYKGTDEAISVRNFTDCLADNRFDAEYWQPNYDIIQNTIKKHKDGYDTLDNLFDISNKKIAVDQNKKYLYLELADVNGAMGTIDNITELQGKELPSRGRMLLKKNDVAMSSLDGSLSKIALVTSDAKNIVGSTGFFVLHQKEYKPEVALVLLKSRLIQTLLERQGQGTILSAIPKQSLSRVVLPKLNPSIQEKIKELVLNAHSQKEEGNKLLEKAKRAVEIFIEQDEAAALNFLNG